MRETTNRKEYDMSYLDQLAPKQRPMRDDWRTLVIAQGRGFGKRYIASRYMMQWAAEKKGTYLWVGRDKADLDFVFKTGDDNSASFTSYKHKYDLSVDKDGYTLTLANGSVIRGITTAGLPRLSIPELRRDDYPEELDEKFDKIVYEDLGSWDHKVARAALKHSWHLLSDADDPRLIITGSHMNLNDASNPLSELVEESKGDAGVYVMATAFTLTGIEVKPVLDPGALRDFANDEIIDILNRVNEVLTELGKTLLELEPFLTAVEQRVIAEEKAVTAHSTAYDVRVMLDALKNPDGDQE